MSTISTKTIESQISNFVKHPKQFESYYKHCINILKEYIWLKKNQYNDEINNYEYIYSFMNYYGISNYFLNILYDDYKNNIVNNIPKDSIINLHSNIYYPDDLEYFMNNNIIDKNKLPNQKYKINYKRLDFSIITNNNLEINKEYTLNEIYDLIINKILIIIDCHLSKTTLNIKEVDYSNNRIFKNRQSSEILGFDNTPIELFYSLNNQNKELWIIIFELFSDYLRFNIINFNEDKKNHINMNTDFYQVLNHINEITKELLKYYKKRKKDIPSIIKKTLDNNLHLIEKYQKDFEKINISEFIINNKINSDETYKKLIKINKVGEK